MNDPEIVVIKLLFLIHLLKADLFKYFYTAKAWKPNPHQGNLKYLC